MSAFWYTKDWRLVSAPTRKKSLMEMADRYNRAAHFYIKIRSSAMKEGWKKWFVPFFLFPLVTICLLAVVLRDSQKSAYKSMPQTITGEYSWVRET